MSYELGLLALISALTVLAVPPPSASASLRWVAVAAGSIAFCAELCWGLVSQVGRRRQSTIQSAHGDDQVTGAAPTPR